MTVVVTDVDYDDDLGRSRTAAVVLADFDAVDPVATYCREATIAAPYLSGAFVHRELPALLPVVQHVAAHHRVDAVVIDAYVDLAVGPGLGRHLHEHLASAGHPAIVIGVAKNPHAGRPGQPLTRGGSNRPLWITAAGVSAVDAAAAIARMAGDHRLPTAVTLADHLARGLRPADVAL